MVPYPHYHQVLSDESTFGGEDSGGDGDLPGSIGFGTRPL